MNVTAYGYVNRTGLSDAELRVLDVRVNAWTLSRNLELGALFVEEVEPEQWQFRALLDRLIVMRAIRSRVYHVVVPSLAHFSGRSVVQQTMRERLEYETGVIVHVMWSGSGG